LEHLLEFFYTNPFPEPGSGHVPLRIMLVPGCGMAAIWNDRVVGCGMGVKWNGWVVMSVATAGRT
jgi:hypothetical protein